MSRVEMSRMARRVSWVSKEMRAVGYCRVVAVIAIVVVVVVRCAGVVARWASRSYFILGTDVIIRPRTCLARIWPRPTTKVTVGPKAILLMVRS